MESVFLAVAAVFTSFGMFCFVKLWFSGFGDNVHSAIFLESGDDTEMLDMKIKEAGKSWLYGRCGVVILIPESRRTDPNIKDYIESKGLKTVYYLDDERWQK